MHARQLTRARLANVDVHALTLANECATIGSHIDDGSLGDLPDSLIDLFDPVRDHLDALNAAVVRDDHVLDIRGPEAQGGQVSHEVAIDADKLTREHSASVDV